MPIDVYAAMGALVRAEAARRSTVPAQSDAAAPPHRDRRGVHPRTGAPPGAARSPRAAAPAPAPRRTGFLWSLRTAWRDVWGMCR
ncbi:hypothetical protein [Streptomyces sp. Rer75]|uniref:hypothetical protein n=1 Tax=Streptomyces sp. Rer75 TaxID=2750011 RepID=UPI0015CFC7FC|nr:hypothetical protein [Streptomyces sp. Rer75]QLH26160.1 hypothetical protein HYQ63_40730 [Streptomyces sp. Rer75]